MSKPWPENITFRVLEPGDREAIKKCQYYLYQEEAVCRALHLTCPEEAEKAMDIFLPDLLSHGLSLAAIDKTTGEVVGLRMGSVVRKTDKPGLHLHPKNGGTWKLMVMEVLWTWAQAPYNLFEMYGVDEYVAFNGLVVLKEYGGKGIAFNLTKEGIKLAKEKGYKMVQGNASSDYTRRVFAACGMEMIAKESFADLKEKGFDIIDLGNLERHLMKTSTHVIKWE